MAYTHTDMVARLDALLSLPEGWYNGEGESLNTEAMREVAVKLKGGYPPDLPLPSLCPTPEGTLVLEWNLRNSPSLEFNRDGVSARYDDLRSNGDGEAMFNLENEQSWTEMFQFLRTVLV